MRTLVKNNVSSCTLICGDSKKALTEFNDQADLIVTSPPYADARNKHYDSVHPDKFVEWFLKFHQPFWDVLKPNGSFVINIKDKVVDGVRHRYVWRTIEALCEMGWFAIDDYVWNKPNPMPGRWPTRLSDGWEYCFHLCKTKKPYFDHEAIKRPIGDWTESRLAKLGKNDTSRHNSVNASGFGRDISRWLDKTKVLPPNVLTIGLVGKNMGHPAVFPVELPAFFIKLLSPKGGLVVDPFGGSGTTGVAALQLGRNCILVDNNADYYAEANRRLTDEGHITLYKPSRKKQAQRAPEQLQLVEKAETSYHAHENGFSNRNGTIQKKSKGQGKRITS